MEREKPDLGDNLPDGVENTADSRPKMNRREALAMVGKHAVYTAPAVLAVLAATKSKNAHADCPQGLICAS